MAWQCAIKQASSRVLLTLSSHLGLGLVTRNARLGPSLPSPCETLPSAIAGAYGKHGTLISPYDLLYSPMSWSQALAAEVETLDLAESLR